MSNHTRPWKADYLRWRHGGWYVCNTRYPNGGCGCVSNNYDDKRWRIVCDSRPLEQMPVFSSREDAAQAERIFVEREALLEACKAVQMYGMKGKMPDGRWAFDLLAPAIAKASGEP